jgi:dephospho-CoA kinase
MLRIGLTGGIGSGKTTVANHFSSLGIAVIDADRVVHDLSRPGQAVYQSIVKEFGKKILHNDATLNRKLLGQIIFNDPALKHRLESIVHPAVRQQMQQEISKADSPYCVLVIPLLAETDFTELVDRVLVVSADVARRIDWVGTRDSIDQEMIKKIMASQASDGQRSRIADDIIENNDSIESLLEKVEVLDRKYRQLCQE